MLCSETDTGIDNSTDIIDDYSKAVPAVGNPVYFETDSGQPWMAPGATFNDEGSYLTCDAAAVAAGNDYYDYSRGEMIAA